MVKTNSPNKCKCTKYTKIFPKNKNLLIYDQYEKLNYEVKARNGL